MKNIGRPTVEPIDKVSVPIRCLITPRVGAICLDAMQDIGINQSDLLRLFIYEGLRKRNLINPLLKEVDQTFKSLRETGLA